MSKVKHFLRKLHIGDHHHHGRPPAALDPSPRTASPSQPLATSYLPSADLPQTALSPDNGSSTNSNFNFFEEEFQMQLALAISVSDPGQNRVDSETAQLNVAKQISLGCSPIQNISEFMSLRYWSCNVVNYDEKVIDGFYDLCGIDSNLVVQTKMPSLKELEATSTLDNIGCEVVLVNHATDVALRKLEERVYYISRECHALDKALNTSFLVQKIAKLIVERMGGPVTDVDDMFRRWRVRNHELRIYLDTIILPLGSLDIGHSRQRALLFKVLADRINLPCKLVKGSYYTGTDEGAVNMIKLDDGSEYIIDLMGAPGTLIPVEVPSGHHQNFGLDARHISTTVGNDSKMCTFNEGAKLKPFTPTVDKIPEIGGSGSELSVIAMESNIEGMRSNDCREDNIQGRNERPLLSITGLQLFSSTFNSISEHSDERLGAHMLKLEPGGRNLPLCLSIPGGQNILVNDRNGAITDDDTAVGREMFDFSGNAETMLISCSNQSNPKIHDVQTDHVLNGVAEILWEDLEIGERIGIDAEWMAPEVLRNELSNEKSDVYSFGVILWELATLLVPWKGMNSMQVVGAVGFQGRHLEIPPTVDPFVAEIINECWNRKPAGTAFFCTDNYPSQVSAAALSVRL
ncbi:hypothetical protein CASFOL_022288 [Castilleja foliolosa]|uniref:Tyrosine-protein kinase catalytic domain-containing protein n=1 Tax=Castilleja foliolosa TaxID=1961234 RepID=A0ABD3CW37_9LAMI